MSDCLVLDNSGRPLHFVDWRDAVTMWFTDRAIIIAEDERILLHSGSFEMNMPRVIKVKNWVAREMQRKVARNRSNFFLRDEGRCQYCGAGVASSEYTLDHVIPRCQGGKSTWLNLVVSCLPCNSFKAGRTPEEAGMKLRRQPFEPSSKDKRFRWRLKIDKLHPSWKPWADGGWLYWNITLDEE